VLWKKAFELRVKLRRESFVMRNNERWPLHIFDDVRDGKSFSRTGHAEKRLMFGSGQKTFGQLRDGLRLISSGLVRGNEFKHAARTYESAKRVSTNADQPRMLSQKY